MRIAQVGPLYEAVPPKLYGGTERVVAHLTDAHILNDEHRNYPVYQQLWTGEDYSRQWPPSERLKILRTGDQKELGRWAKRKKKAR